MISFTPFFGCGVTTQRIPVHVGWILCFALAANARGDQDSFPTVLGHHVKDVVVKPGADFSGRALRGSQFCSEDLSGASFDNADLNGTRFLECDLSGASFKNASLSGATIEDCKMAGADFLNADITNYDSNSGLPSEQLLKTRSFREKTLRGYAFSRAALGSHTDLRGFDLRDARLYGDLRDVRFDGAQITGAKFSGRLDFEQLRNTVEVKDHRFPAKFSARTGSCNLANLNLRNAEIHLDRGVPFDLTNAKIDYCHIWFGGNRATEALASTWSFKQRRIRSTRLTNADLSGVCFDDMILDRLDLSSVDLNDASFRNAVFVGASLSAVGESLSAEQVKQSYNAKNDLLSEAGLSDRLKAELGIELVK